MSHDSNTPETFMKPINIGRPDHFICNTPMWSKQSTSENRSLCVGWLHTGATMSKSYDFHNRTMRQATSSVETAGSAEKGRKVHYRLCIKDQSVSPHKLLCEIRSLRIN